MENPNHKPFIDLPFEIRKLMVDNKEHLLRLRGSGLWTPCKDYQYMGEGYVFKVDPNAPLDPVVPVARPPRTCKVFCGSDNIYKVDVAPEGSPKKSVRYLTTAVGMVGFDGIRYKNSDKWFTVLNIPANGVPDEIRFSRR